MRVPRSRLDVTVAHAGGTIIITISLGTTLQETSRTTITSAAPEPTQLFLLVPRRLLEDLFESIGLHPFVLLACLCSEYACSNLCSVNLQGFVEPVEYALVRKHRGANLAVLLGSLLGREEDVLLRAG